MKESRNQVETATKKQKSKLSGFDLKQIAKKENSINNKIITK